MDMDHRTSTRAAVTYPVRLSSDSMTGEGTVINLSVPGCAIETDLPVQPGEYLELLVMAPDQARPLTVGLAKVRWTTNQKVGIEFIRVRRDDQSRIQRLISPVARRVGRERWNRHARTDRRITTHIAIGPSFEFLSPIHSRTSRWRWLARSRQAQAPESYASPPSFVWLAMRFMMIFRPTVIRVKEMPNAIGTKIAVATLAFFSHPTS